MTCLEVKKMPSGGRLCEMCLVEAGPSRSGQFAVFLAGYPADECCGVHKRLYEKEFAQAAERGAK